MERRDANHTSSYGLGEEGAVPTNPVDEILLDLAGVTAMDSHGLGELTVAYTAAQQQRGSLGQSESTVRNLLQIDHLDEFLL